MKRKMYLLLALLMIAALVLTACSGGKKSEETYTLVLTNGDSDESLPGQWCHEWAKMVNEKSNGRIIVEVNNGGSIANHGQAMGMVSDGSVDIALLIHSPYPDVFPMTECFHLPMLDLGTGEAASRAFTDIYENTDLLDNEYGGFKVILLRTTMPAPLITRTQKINSAADLQGLIVRSTVNPLNKTFDKFGIKGENVPIGELYSVLQNGSFDGAITDWHGVHSYKLAEVADFYADEAFQYITYSIVMNLDKYNSLPDDLKKVIDECSGSGAIGIMASAWDDLASQVKDDVRKAGGEVYKLPDDLRNAMKAEAAKAIEEWIADQEARGRPAQRMYDTILETVKKYQ